MGSQRVGHNLVTEQQYQSCKTYKQTQGEQEFKIFKSELIKESTG